MKNMKKITSIIALGLALVFSSCMNQLDETINVIEGLYTAPADAVQLTTLAGSESVWQLDRRLFNLSFSGNGTLSTTLVGYDYSLPSGQYVITPSAAAQIGDAVAEKTLLNGSPVSSGYILVNKQGSAYQITAVLNNSEAVLTWAGNLPFTPDPDPTVLSVVQQAQSNVANGVNSVTLQLATDGISSTLDWTTWQTVWTGEGGYLALDLYSDDGYLHEGVYMPSAAGGVINPGEFGIGWDPGDIYGIGMEFTDWGTCWWAVSDGAAVAKKITGGAISVTKVDAGWQIAWGENYPQELVFTGAIPALTKTEKPSGPVQLDYTYTIGEPQPCSTSAGDVVAGVMKYPFTIVDANAQEVAYLEFVLAEGAADIEPGDYVSTEYASAVGQLANGYYLDFSDFGWGIIAGGSYYIADGEKVYIDPGVTVTVEQVATGAFLFYSTGFSYAAAGPNYVPDDGGGDDSGDDLEGIVLKISSGLTYTMEDQTASNTDASQNPLSGVTLWRVNVLQGSDLVANFDLVVAEGQEDLAGTYTVMSYPDAVGKAGNGWGFAAWNMFGGCYYIVDGAYYFIPADATVNVTANADGSLKFKFSGSVQDENYADAGAGGLLLDNVAKQ